MIKEDEILDVSLDNFEDIMCYDLCIVSDNHGTNVEEIASLKTPGREFIHCGDSNMPLHLMDEIFDHWVSGNTDEHLSGEDYMAKELSYFGKKFLLTHGDLISEGRGVDYENDIVNYALEHGSRGVIFGHSHHKTVKEKNGVLLINPGALRGDYMTYRIGYITVKITPCKIKIKYIPMNKNCKPTVEEFDY